MTILSRNRKCLFSEVKKGEIRLSSMGEIVREEWLETGLMRPAVTIDEFVVMPNHLHGILLLATGEFQHCCKLSNLSTLSRSCESLGSIIAGFKAATTRRIRAISPRYPETVWHRNYFEHVIRSGGALQRIREYIRYNPLRWGADQYNPSG